MYLNVIFGFYWTHLKSDVLIFVILFIGVSVYSMLEITTFATIKMENFKCQLKT